MKKHWLWLCVGFVILVSGGIVAALLEPTQTVRGYFAGDAFYRGRPTRYWRKYLRADGGYGRVSSTNVSRFSDTHAAFAVLRECASDPHWKVRRSAIALLGAGEARSEEILSVLVGALDDEDEAVRLQAVKALDHWGPMARSAVPALANRLKNDSVLLVVHYADIALWDIDPSAAVGLCGWRRFRSDEGKFTVMLPSEPEHSEPFIPFADTHSFVALHKIGSHNGDVAYGIFVSEFPAEFLEGKNKEEIMAKERDSTLEKFRGKLIGEQPIEQNGWKGLELRFDIEEEGLSVRRRLFWADNRLYQVWVTGVPQFLNIRAADYFIASFQPDQREPERR
ncbi:MAG TPA: HEAT repeat domain-containing protein [Gemmataceae bacterium]|nr:HEAT repeat domain-containing protein [Gemmataceae bacterium]